MAKNELYGAFELTESDIKRAICDLLDRYPNRCFFFLTPGIQASRSNRRSKFMPVGVSDITGVWDGKPLFIEVKTPGGKVSQEQNAFISQALFHGSIAFVARSLNDVKDRLKI